MARKPDALYKQMVRMLRHGFVDAEKTDTLTVTDAATRARQGLPPVSKTQAIRDLKSAGYTIGKETEFNPRTGELTDVRRTGKIARGFEAVDGFDLRDVDQLTPAQKAHITRTFKAVQKLSAQPYQEYRGRKPENLERVQEASHGDIKTPAELVVAFVPVARPGERAQIKILKDRIEIIEREVIRTPVKWGDVTDPATGKAFTMTSVADDPKAAVRALAAHTGGERFQFMAAKSPMFGRAFTAKGLEAEIENLQKQYPRWASFLIGIQAFTAQKAKDLTDYRTSKGKAKLAQSKERKRAATIFRRKIRAEEKRRKERARKKRK